MKTAIVTGASSGIGKACAKILLSSGRKVYGIGRDFTEPAVSHESFYPIVCDLQKTEELCQLIKKIQKENEIDVLLNNAGVGYFGLHEELNPKKIKEMVTVNLEVPLLLSQMLLRDLKKNAGYIISISSITAKQANPHGCAYGATKAGLSSFMDSIFLEARKYGVKAVTIHPDMTESNFYRNADFREDSAMDAKLLPDEVASAVEWILNARDGLVITDLSLRPQKHRLKKMKQPEI